MAKEKFDNSFDMLLVEHRNITKELLEATKENRKLKEENTGLKELLREICANKGLIHIRNFEHLNPTDVTTLECKLERWFIKTENFLSEAEKWVEQKESKK